MQYTKPLWTEAREVPPLVSDTRTSLCVVGAGITGLTTAYLMAREGVQVVVLDKGSAGGGETGRTTAHVSCVLDHRYFELEEIHGRDATQLAVASHGRAIDQIEK